LYIEAGYPSITQGTHSIAIILVVALFLRRLRKLFLPPCIRLRSVDIGENEVEDVAVPRDGLAFDARFDVLLDMKLVNCDTV
jgi:hypothetical protein